MLNVVTRTPIAATREQAWEALTTLAAYGDWNPIIRRVDGELSVDTTITIHVAGPAGARPWDVTVAVMKPDLEFGWTFVEGHPWLYRGEHVFRLEDGPEGIVLVDRERFWGILVPLRRRGLRQRITASMSAMASALTTHLEHNNAA